MRNPFSGSLIHSSWADIFSPAVDCRLFEQPFAAFPENAFSLIADRRLP